MAESSLWRSLCERCYDMPWPKREDRFHVNDIQFFGLLCHHITGWIRIRHNAEQLTAFVIENYGYIPEISDWIYRAVDSANSFREAVAIIGHDPCGCSEYMFAIMAATHEEKMRYLSASAEKLFVLAFEHAFTFEISTRQIDELAWSVSYFHWFHSWNMCYDRKPDERWPVWPHDVVKYVIHVFNDKRTRNGYADSICVANRKDESLLKIRYCVGAYLNNDELLNVVNGDGSGWKWHEYLTNAISDPVALPTEHLLLIGREFVRIPILHNPQMAEPFAIHIQAYERAAKFARESSAAWIGCAMRLGLCFDVYRIVGIMVWNDRMQLEFMSF